MHSGVLVGFDFTPYVPAPALDWDADNPGATAALVHGTLTFVDLSGFTAMSERLARLGKRGAEEVTDIVSSTFAALLAHADDGGASLLKFGGDALLLLFTGRDHPGRGVRAAYAMRRGLRRLGPLRTPVGEVRLRMSCGVNSGVIHLFVVGGSSHRELIVAGPVTTATASLEAGAVPGEIRVGEATAASLPKRCLARADPGFRLVAPPPPVPAGADPAANSGRHRPDRGGAAAEFVPAAVRAHLEGGGTEPEHRQAAIAFVRATGLDSLLDRGAVGDAAGRLEALVKSAQEAADTHDVCFLGTDVTPDGTKVILTAGVPRASDDDHQRLLRAVLDVLGGDCGLDVAVGVHRGTVFGGDVGPTYRRTYTVMGDTVNTAARVMAAARPGEVLVTDAVIGDALGDHVGTPFPLQAKGKKAPITVRPLRGDPTVGVERTSEPPIRLLGREEEIRAVMAAVRDGGGAVEVRGERGIGKTALVGAVRAAYGASSEITVQADRYDSATPYGGFRPILRKLLHLTGPVDPVAVSRAVAVRAPSLDAHVPFLVDVLGGEPAGGAAELGARMTKRRREAAVEEVLAELTPAPALVVADDAQSLDEPSLRILTRLASAARARRWLVVVAHRGDRRLDETAVDILLGPLAPSASARLVRRLSPRPLLPTHERMLAVRARGNPRFLAELVRGFDPDAPPEALPSTVEAAVAARLDRLPPAKRSVLRRLAVIGTRAPLGVAAAVAETADGELSTLDEFIEVHADMIVFRDGLVRDVAYAGLSYRRRRELHAAVAAHIERMAPDSVADAAQLALHFHHAEYPERAWHYARQAAADAARRDAQIEAIDLCRIAVAAARQLPATASGVLGEMWQLLGHSLVAVGRLEEARRPYRMARQLLAGDDGAMAWLCLLEGELSEGMGQLRGATGWYQRGLRHLEGRDLTADEQRYRARLLLGRAKVRFNRGRLFEALHDFTNVWRSAEASGDLGGEAHACNWLQLTYTQLGDPDGRRFGERAVELYGRLNSPVMQAEVLNSLALDAQRFGRWDDAAEYFGRSRRGLEATEMEVGACVVATNLGQLLTDQGRLVEARDALEHAWSGLAAAGHLYEPVAMMSLGRVLFLLGDRAAGADLVSDATARCDGAGLSDHAQQGRRMQAEIALALRTPADALEVLDPADTSSDAYRLRGLAFAALGRTAEEREALVEAEATARSAANDFSRALALLAVAALGEAGAEQYETEAEGILERLGVVSVPEYLRRDPARPALAAP